VAAEEDQRLREIEQKRATASDGIVNSDSEKRLIAALQGF
jgi:hypothetical protein